MIDVKYCGNGKAMTVRRSWIGVELTANRDGVIILKCANIRTPEELRTFKAQFNLAVQDWRILADGKDPRPPPDGSTIGGSNENPTHR